jgi:predicted DNA-binding protein
VRHRETWLLGPGGWTVIPSYTQCMKTAISVPDDTYERACRRAKDLGMSRSEFFARAAAHYIEQLDSESLTEQIDQAVTALRKADHSAADAVSVGHRVLGSTTDEW